MYECLLITISVDIFTMHNSMIFYTHVYSKIVFVKKPMPIDIHAIFDMFTHFSVLLAQQD